ncbi:uncharacterized protein P174DRAFT_457104 [Aspergillus novofumigatus IBT 16806]|uniref:Integral membrane protein n=1 Tax=Aspergillus novofumigatus (strain IBT 16806) TaxID=1392255 RepID=A0A2I1CFB9_ASPN1|nr:uncharacterized protein P174DRAFT_457104 [Aspergillus novofumigatus IBT 16806]PKX96301.1 hypothetical protein P174DRAFT_457104 [Aspergillus novofumigatus IBT 16806]
MASTSASEPELKTSSISHPTSTMSSTSTLTQPSPTVTLTLKNERLHLSSSTSQYKDILLASDFAANVWNEVPLPTHAKICMGIFGPIVLLMTIFTARDFALSYANVLLLLSEQEALRSSQHATTSLPEKREKEREGILGVNTRELLTKLMDCILMDVLLGAGDLLVSTGTIMAIFSNNRTQRVRVVTGAAGHAPLLGEREQRRVTARYRMLQWHGAMNGLNGLVAGMASMVTAKMWWGYVVLVPCVGVVIASNRFWRLRLGYCRFLYTQSLREGDRGEEDEEGGEIAGELAKTLDFQGTLPELIDSSTLDSLMDFIVRNERFDVFCEYILRRWKHHRLFTVDVPTQGIQIAPKDFMPFPKGEQTRMLDECRCFLQDDGMRILLYRERYLQDLLGEIIWTDNQS